MGYILKNTQSGRVLHLEPQFVHKDATMTGASYGVYSEFTDDSLIGDRTVPLSNFHNGSSSHPKYRAIYDSYSVSGAHLPSGASTGTTATGYGYNDSGSTGGGNVRTMLFNNAYIYWENEQLNLQCEYKPTSLLNCGTASNVDLYKQNGRVYFFSLPLSLTPQQGNSALCGQCYEFSDAASGAVIPLRFIVEQSSFTKSGWGYSAATVSPYQYEVIFDLSPISHLITTCTQIAVFDELQSFSDNKEELEWWLQFGYNSTNNTALQTINITSLSHIKRHSSMSSFTTDLANPTKTLTTCAILNSTCLNAIKNSTGNSLKLRVVANRIPNDAGVSSYNTYLTQYSRKIFTICFMF